MQSSIIDGILTVEDEAEKIVSDAEAEARNIIFNAQKEAKELISKEIDEIRKKNDQIIEDEEALFKENLKEYEDVRLEIEKNGVKTNSEALKRAKDRIVSLILD